ncbi:MAG: beta-glucosidase [Propionibacteriaceae bacterium]|jgi:beta-glucosidase|nr:beta-glucosidase [Propionibacteriaceae bacterium]
MPATFPKDFLWGSATASYQIEGAVDEDGRGPSIWDVFSHTPGKVARGETGDVACDHYHRWREDVALLADLGVGAYRLSIAWPRVQPTGAGAFNQAGLDFYDHLVDALLAAGIAPVVTLYHWDLPQALQEKGGWVERDTAHRFAAYAERMATTLGDRVRLWTTFNEPWCVAYLGHASGEHAPGAHNPAAALTSVHHLNLAHGLGVQAIKAARSGAQTSIVWNLQALKPATDDAEDLEACAKLSRVGNEIFTDPVLGGSYPAALFEDTARFTTWDCIREDDLATIHQPIDAVGINYYTTATVAAAPGVLYDSQTAHPSPWIADDVRFIDPPGPRTDMGWLIDPSGLTTLLTDFHQRWPGIPLMVTENGAACADTIAADGGVHDPARIDYLDAHIGAVHAAIEDGAPVCGYFAWSLMDNFEWAHGYGKRFGLTYVDYPTQRRIPKDSFAWYQGVIARNGLA